MLGNEYVVGPSENRISKANNGKTIEEIVASSSIYFDTAQGAPSHHHVLRSMGVHPSKILSGTDYPFVGKGPDWQRMKAVLHAPREGGLYSTEQWDGIRAINALNLFPRCKREWINAGLVIE